MIIPIAIPNPFKKLKIGIISHFAVHLKTPQPKSIISSDSLSCALSTSYSLGPKKNLRGTLVLSSISVETFITALYSSEYLAVFIGLE